MMNIPYCSILTLGGFHDCTIEDASSLPARFLLWQSLSSLSILANRSQRHRAVGGCLATQCPIADRCATLLPRVQLLIWSSIKRSVRVGHSSGLLFFWHNAALQTKKRVERHERQHGRRWNWKQDSVKLSKSYSKNHEGMPTFSMGVSLEELLLR
jgi:hypothetical protein